MKQTVVGVFDRYAAAQHAARALEDCGFDHDHVHVTGVDEPAGDGAPSERATRDEGVLGSIRHFFSDLFGPDDSHAVGPYAEALRRGGAVVKVDVDEDDDVEKAREALQQAGDVRVYPHAGERPPDEPAPPRSERATAGSEAFEDHDTEFRRDFDTNYAATGARYEDYEPAYRYGHGLASDSRYAGRPWDDIEPDVRADWERSNPGSAWERFEASVRHAWARATR